MIQELTTALVAVLDSAPAVLALTGRAAGADNIVAWVEDPDVPMLVPALPVLAYAFLDASEYGPIEGTRRYVFQLTAAADTQAAAHALAETAIAALTYAALLAAGVDAYVERANPSREAPETAAAGGGSEGVYRTNLDVTIVA